MKMVSVSDLVSRLLLVTVVVNNVSGAAARTWYTGEDDRVRWDVDCDFYGREVATRASDSGDECADFCIANPSCTHYTYVSGACHMKRARGLTESPYGGSSCGWIINRNSQPW